MSDDDLETAAGVVLCIVVGALSYALALTLVSIIAPGLVWLILTKTSRSSHEPPAAAAKTLG